MLQVAVLHAYYGKSHILQGVTLEVGEGEIVALLGRNGVGRSTTCKAIMGEVPPSGSILFHGKEMVGRKPYEIAQAGIGYVPENRDIFAVIAYFFTKKADVLPADRHILPAVSAIFSAIPTIFRTIKCPAGMPLFISIKFSVVVAIEPF